MTASDQAVILSPQETNHAAKAAVDIRAIREPITGIRTPLKSPLSKLEVFEIAAGLLIVALTVWLIVRSLRQRESALNRVVPPHEHARLRLAQALRRIDDQYWFCSEVSSAIRDYLEARFSLHAPDRTTEEFLIELQSSAILTREQQQSLGIFLGECDLVKFAKHVPTETELRSLHQSALRLISETEPPPLSQAVGNQPSQPVGAAK